MPSHQSKYIILGILRTIEKDANYCDVSVEAGSCISAYIIIAIITFLGIVLFFLLC